MKVFNREVGRRGEEIAAGFLQRKGYELVLRNYSTRYGEIDLICRGNGVIVFVEVKAKKGLKFGRPEEMFTRYKLEKVKRMATVYLEGRDVPCRIDMVAVVLDEFNRPVEIKHYQNVT
ncbi:MAG: hypothetical protein UY33_C0036G0012 [Candidatus Amesbacteria bacterium GW2011_GWA1_48_9]|uniref:UPF0102 protein UY33_C0036G0012 n=2 Tax=Candidatus Amesiibacteriota TaxID=1752730 RepID=A0A0G1UYE6_9BACT|nr:MAG: hypothetical protein UY33_C0036G0012 [Candidatus Amesbacteria bacterium GW2011_GWA1_48_9]